MNVAIIPARGGSKRIPGKNIKPFAGKPIIAYSIQAALDTGIFDKVIVTTDSQDIADIAKKHGAEVPFLRPANLSDDHTATAPVLIHTLEWLFNQGVKPELACCIYATAPFVQPESLQLGYKIMEEHNCTTSYSVASFPFPIYRGLRINDDGCLKMIWPEYEMTRSQDLPEAYHDAGQFYWIDCKKFIHNPRLYAVDSRPIILPRYLVQDIDTNEDWTRAEYMYQAMMLGKKDNSK